VLLGANGSGKSNIISFFKMLNFMMSGSFQLFVEKSGDEPGIPELRFKADFGH
jgi:predicted ATPase